MRQSAVAALALLLLTACSTQLTGVAPNDELGATVTRTEDLVAGIAETLTLSAHEMRGDDDFVCEDEQRLGSRIARKSCYFRSEQSASQPERREQVQEDMEYLRREKANRDAWEQIRRSARQPF